MNAENSVACGSAGAAGIAKEPVLVGSEADKTEQATSDMVSEPSTSCNETSALQIFVSSLHGKTITLEVEPSDTIRNVKVKILERESIATHRQRLIFDGTKLKDHLKISETNIKNQSTIRMMFESSRSIRTRWIDVQNCIQFADYCRLYSPTKSGMAGDRCMEIDWEKTTIGEFKLCIGDIPRDDVLLMLGGEVMSNDDQLVADAMKGKDATYFRLYSTKCHVDLMPPPMRTYVDNHECMKTKKSKKTEKKESNNLLRKVLTKSAGEKM